MQRPGTTYRLLDRGRYTLSVGAAWRCDGSHRDFRVEWFTRGGGSRHGFTIPRISFARAFALKRFGGLRIWQIQEGAMRRLARPAR